MVETCRAREPQSVPNLRKRTSLQARALARLAWSHSAERKTSKNARECYQEALELEPANPYFLADVIGFEIDCFNNRAFVGAMAAVLRGAIATCREHMTDGTEMPFASFTSGRLRLLLGENEEALCDYAGCASHARGDTLGSPRRARRRAGVAGACHAAR